MIFDREVCFANALDLQSFTSGQLGDVIDLGAPDQLQGRPASLAISFNADTTATGDPEFTFELEFADNEDFDESVKVPVPMQPLKKADMQAGMIACAPTPTYSKRYVKLVATGTGAIACSNIDAGFVLDAQSAGVR